MRKRIIAGCLATMLLAVPFQTMAKTAVFGNITADGKIKIHISSDVGASTYGVHILKPNQVIGDVNQVVSGTSSAFAGFEVGTLSADDDNAFHSTEVEFTLNDLSEEGVYTVIVGGGEIAGKELKLAYNDAYPQAATEAKAASDIEPVLTQYQNQAWYLDFSNPVYVANKNLVHTNMKAILETADTTNESVVQAYQEACILAELKTCSKDEIFDNLLVNEQYLGLDYASVVNGNSEKIANTFFDLRNDEALNTVSDLSRLVRASRAVMLLNEAGRDDVIGILSTYNDIFTLDFSGDYAEVDPYAVAKKMVVAEGDAPYTTLAQVRTKFTQSVADVILATTPTPTPVPTQRPSNIGGGGGGGGVTVVAPPASEETKVDAEKLAEQDTKEIFNDLDSAQWAIPYIKYLSENHIMQGDGKGNFRPNDGILREEFLKLILEAFDVEIVSDAEIAFSDVVENAWYYDYVVTAVSMNLVQGISETEFGVGRYISRQDAAVLLQRILEKREISLTEKDQKTTFTDSNKISEYATEAVALLSKAKIINGYENGEFAPEKSILRCEAAKIIYSTIKAMER